MKKICCIYSRNKLDFKKYAKSTKYDDVINYNDITSKLIKNDINSIKPSTIVINSYIRKKLLKALENEKSKAILYALKTLEKDTVSAIKELIADYHTDEYEMNLIVLNPEKLKINIEEYVEFLEQFDKIEYVEV